ncbi:MAG: 23S rRNA (uracil(1939)-C(5))-methyltransferase RlmD [Gammaproteobacteria bacterium]|nr:23S rRNA (uracil(1939)-C(5))-methyltransferase RlmD [Gammaproteobacteria bacterium]
MPRKPRHKRMPSEPATVLVTQLSHEGRGIAHIDGKTTFILAALPGETVQFKYTQIHRQFDEGIATDILENSSPDRSTPPCAHFGICGGCSLQHMTNEAQRDHKQKIVLEHFQHQAHCQPKEILPPLIGNTLGYRRKARLSVRFVPKKEAVLVGFRERGTSYVALINQCEILHPSVGHKIKALSELLMLCDKKSDIPQLEIAVGDTLTAIIIRHLSALPDHDIQLLIAFAKENNLQLYLQSKGPETIQALYPANPAELFYDIPAHQIRMTFKPEQFTQINADINLQMIDRAIALLDLKKTDRVLDLFCGIGNFSLPIAKQCAQMIGVEGAEDAINQAKKNALENNITNAEFYTQDLIQDLQNAAWSKNQYDKVLLDPARAGAKEILSYMAIWKPERIVYVSCNPITLARDTSDLIALGYSLEKAGIMDMFPHTEHVEAIALFIKQ